MNGNVSGFSDESWVDAIGDDGEPYRVLFTGKKARERAEEYAAERFLDVFQAEKGSKITFRLQNGPIREVGVNGVQIDTVIEWAKAKIEGFNRDFPCRENSLVITKLDEALLWLLKRRLDRESRGVEGLNKP